MSKCMCDVIQAEGIVTVYTSGEILYLHETQQLVICPSRCLKGWPGPVTDSTFWSAVDSAVKVIVEGDGTEAMPVQMVTVCMACRGLTFNG